MSPAKLSDIQNGSLSGGPSASLSRSSAPGSPSSWRSALQRHGQLSDELRKTGLALKRQTAENEKLRAACLELETRMQSKNSLNALDDTHGSDKNEQALSEQAWIAERRALLAEQQRLETEVANAQRRVQASEARRKQVAQCSVDTCLGCMALEADIDALSEQLELRKHRRAADAILKSEALLKVVSAPSRPTEGRSQESALEPRGVEPQRNSQEQKLEGSGSQSGIAKRLSFGQGSSPSNDSVFVHSKISPTKSAKEAFSGEEVLEASEQHKTQQLSSIIDSPPTILAARSGDVPGNAHAVTLSISSPKGDLVSEPAEVLAACGEALARGLEEMRAAVALLDSELGPE